MTDFVYPDNLTNAIHEFCQKRLERSKRQIPSDKSVPEKTCKIAFSYFLEQNCKAYEGVRDAGSGDIEQGLKIMQAMHEVEKATYGKC